MYKVMHVIGARPHFMKLAPLYRVIGEDPGWTQVVVHTGQHYDERLSAVFFSEFGLDDPDFNLEVGSGRQVVQMSRIMERLDEVIRDQAPDMIFVYGDTNSTAAGAIAAAKNNIPLAHIEAGLREFDKQIPEEVNKLITDAVSDLYFCPTATAVRNLSDAGITRHVHLVGDTVLDWLAMCDSGQRPANDVRIFGVEPGQYYLLTCHRAANTDHAPHLRAIWTAAGQLELPVIFPVHPRTKQALQHLDLLQDQPAHLQLIEPTGFWAMQSLIREARAVLTDSGGVIKEAYFYRTPTVILDRQTEWVEVVEEGWATITGPDTARILAAVRDLRIPGHHAQVLGGAGAAAKIMDITKNYLDETH
ncbi:MAG: UDP-N-acetylglucosamine 2-epimerase (non-hydrolyzing) [Saprospiraceae bacterium]|nr:UDP-N-acetylglucosamine 2-epimerase (non-hydrolyzing) [Saprospiraceae bacterium]